MGQGRLRAQCSLSVKARHQSKWCRVDLRCGCKSSRQFPKTGHSPGVGENQPAKDWIADRSGRFAVRPGAVETTASGRKFAAVRSMVCSADGVDGSCSQPPLFAAKCRCHHLLGKEPHHAGYDNRIGSRKGRFQVHGIAATARSSSIVRSGAGNSGHSLRSSQAALSGSRRAGQRIIGRAN